MAEKPEVDLKVTDVSTSRHEITYVEGTFSLRFSGGGHIEAGLARLQEHLHEAMRWFDRESHHVTTVEQLSVEGVREGEPA